MSAFGSAGIGADFSNDLPESGGVSTRVTSTQLNENWRSAVADHVVEISASGDWAERILAKVLSIAAVGGCW